MKTRHNSKGELVWAEITLPVPMPTWNRILGMCPAVRMKLRKVIHAIVDTTARGFGLRELFELEYIQLIRPNAKRKAKLKEMRRGDKNA
jgi:hypothetical protein